MSKYIDAELLKAKLDEHYRKYQSKYMETRNPYTQGLIDALDLAEQIIDSLQHEQQDFPTTDEQIKEFLATHPKIKVPEKYKNPDWLFKKQEQQESSKGNFVFPNFLYARTVDNKTIDVSYAPQSMDAVEYIKNDPTEQPEVDLEKEIDACWRNWLSPSNQKEVEGVLPKTEFAMYARHFYELGIKARKV